jgi:hypothetical protein
VKLIGGQAGDFVHLVSNLRLPEAQ